VEQEDQFTHEISLEDDLDRETNLRFCCCMESPLCYIDNMNFLTGDPVVCNVMLTSL